MTTPRVAERVRELLSALPRVEHALAYGSVVLKDASVSRSERALDVLALVEDPLTWHAANMAQNPSHYAPQMRAIGARGVVGVSRGLGCGTHYNARLTDASGRGYKYGIASVEDVVRDLVRWEHMFVAGRMQKPHETVVESEALREARERNVRNAASAALLVLPETFTEFEFHRAVVRLSYDGDIRFSFAAEDEKKIERIARSNGDAMRDMYADALREIGTGGDLEASTTNWSQNKSAAALERRLLALPAAVLTMIRSHLGLTAVDDSALAIAVREALKDDTERMSSLVKACLRRIVRTSSLRQALSGLISTSPAKTLAYVGAKFSKSARSRLE